MKVLILNYGASNLFSITSAFKRINVEAKVSDDVEEADLLVLPGVGNFSHASRTISRLREKILKAAENGTSVLGICLGLHLFFEGSEEGPGQGLGVIRGYVRKLNEGKVPHMGWSYTKLTQTLSFWPFKEGAWFYYAHSYYAPYVREYVYAEAENEGTIIPAIVVKESFVGFQFHPEKSGEAGLLLLKQYLEVIRK